MWEPRRLTTLWAFAAYYRDNCTFAVSTAPTTRLGAMLLRVPTFDRVSLCSCLEHSCWMCLTQILISSRPGRFTLRERAPGTHSIGVWVGPGSRTGRYGVAPVGNRTLAIQSVASGYAD
jgi:hypothetical protein